MQGSTLQSKLPTHSQSPVLGRNADCLLTPQEVAELCFLSRRRIYDWLTWGWLRGYRRGGRWVVTTDDWEFFACTCRGAHGRLMPSLRDWEPIWNARSEDSSCI